MYARRKHLLEEVVDPFTRISGYYEKLIKQYGHDPRACDYGIAESQQIKFRVLSEVMPLSRRTVLDIGCGFADFAIYLKKRYSAVQYCGLDLCPDMIERARNSRPDLNLRVGNVLDAYFDKTFDVVTANGIFYLLGKEAWSLMQAIIGRMFELATSAVAFNSLSAWADEKEDGEFYADPLQVVSFCRTLTPWVTLRNDYHPRDFTVYMYRTAKT